jgi:tRNA threonylcarbamoyladenosine modification (KEOPS) complex Cgi121 subunit
LRIENLDSDESTTFVGLSDILNSNKRDQDELLELAKSLTSPELTVQLMNGHLIVDETHLLSAAQNALNAKDGGYMQARNLDVEVLVYASAQRQIGKAIEAFGVFDGIEHVAAVVIGCDKERVEEAVSELVKHIGTESKSPFEATKSRFERILGHFEIGIEEVETLTDSTDEVELQKALSKCVVSRVSLIAIDS